MRRIRRKRALTRANAKMPRRRPIETAARQVTDSSFWQARRPANHACGWHEGLSAEAAGSRQGEMKNPGLNLRHVNANERLRNVAGYEEVREQYRQFLFLYGSACVQEAVAD